jgi:hypothetical protein
MSTETPPYINAYGNITRTLNKIKAAQTPPRFTQDFLGTKLDLTGGGARPVIPFLKRIGLLGSDGVPTERYKRFRNPTQSGRAAHEALKDGYRALYEVNEYIHDASNKDLLGVVVQVTGLEANSSTVKAIVGSFKALKEFARFKDTGDDEENGATDEQDAGGSDAQGREEKSDRAIGKGLNLSYTINLHLPPMSNIKVFDAIFKSLRENLLR